MKLIGIVALFLCACLGCTTEDGRTASPDPEDDGWGKCLDTPIDQWCGQEFRGPCAFNTPDPGLIIVGICRAHCDANDQCPAGKAAVGTYAGCFCMGLWTAQ